MPYNIPAIRTDASMTIEIPELTGAETITDYQGTSRPRVRAGAIFFDAVIGIVNNVYLSNGSIYPLQERRGNIAFDVSANHNHGRIKTSHKGLYRWFMQDDSLLNEWEISAGHNSYFNGKGKGFRVSNFPLSVAFTASMLVSARGGQVALDFGSRELEWAIDIGKQSKWLTLRKNNDVWEVWLAGTRLFQTNEAVGNVAGDIDALIGNPDLPIATREFRLWNRALTDIEMLDTASVANPDIRWTASSSTKNPVKNLAGDEYDGVGQPVIANCPADKATKRDALNLPCTILQGLNAQNVPAISTQASYTTFRKPIKLDTAIVGRNTKYLVATRTFFRGGARSKVEDIRVLEVAR